MLKYSLLRRPRSKPVIMMATLFVLILFILAMSQGIWSGTKMQKVSGIYRYEEADWKLTGDDESLPETVESGSFLPFEYGEDYSLSAVLTYDGTKDRDPYCFFHVNHMFCRVSLDDQVLFSYMPEDIRKWDNSKSPGFIYKAIPLPEDCQGKTFRVDFTPGLTMPMAYEVPEMLFGDYGTGVRHIFSRDLPHNIVTILCMLLGVSALVFSAASLTGSDYREGFNVGDFALLVSMYFLTESETFYYYIGNPYYLYFINLVMLSLMPVSFMGVMRECMSGTRRKICTAVIAAEMTFFLTQIILHMSGVWDLREALPCVHVLGFTEVILVSALILSSKENERKLSLMLQLAPVAAGMVADALIYWQHWEVGVNDATFTTVGVLIFLFKQLISKMVSQARKLTDMQQHTIEGMATLIESRDGSTGAHVRNTGVYARMIAEEMYRLRMYPREINDEFVDMIGRMAPLHDVGKIKIPDAILNKPGKFTPEEYEVMKTHADMGGKIIGDILKQDLEPETLQMAVNIATYHHERWDGKGYPTGKKGTEIPLCARIMAVADVFDALSSKRVYKPEMEIDQVFHEMIINEDKQFQKEIVEIVVSLRPQLEAYIQKNKKAAAREKKPEAQ